MSVPVAENLFWSAMDVAAKSTVLFALAVIAVQLGRGSAALRHALRTFAMAAALLLPIAALLLPAWEWRILPAAPLAQPAFAAPVAQPAAAALPVVAEVARTPDRNHRHQSNQHSSYRPSATIVAGQATPIATTSAVEQPQTWPWSLPNFLLLAWTVGASLLAARLCVGMLRIHRLLGNARPLADGQWLGELAQAASHLRIRRPITLLESSEIEVPMTYGFIYPRVLLPASARDWDHSQRRTVLHHELAHILRLDSLTQLLALLAEVIYWPNPLVWLHSLQMRMERERACDDFVLRYGARPSEYATQLLEIANGRQIGVALALPMARRSQLRVRLAALLDPSVRRDAVPRSLLAGVAVVTLAILSTVSAVHLSAVPLQEPKPAPTPAVTPAVPQPAVPQQPEAEQSPVEAKQQQPPKKLTPATAADSCFTAGKNRQHHNSIHEDGQSRLWTATWSGDGCSVDLRAEGAITFAADASSIESISSGGYLETSEHMGMHSRHVKVTPEQGQLRYQYSVDGQTREFDAGARAWFSSFLVALERVSGMVGSRRVPLLIKQGGPEGVLSEVQNISSDYVKSIYLRTLLESAQLTPDVLRAVTRQAGEQIESDYELGRVLTDIATRYTLDDEAMRVTFLSASSHLESDYEHARVLMQLLQRPRLSREVIEMALASTLKLQSDYEKGRVLTTLASQKLYTDAMQDVYLRAVRDIKSDYERARTLIALMEGTRISNSSLAKLLEAASEIESDHEKGRVLAAAAQSYRLSGPVRVTYLRVAGSIQSQTERERALAAVENTDTMM